MNGIRSERDRVRIALRAMGAAMSGATAASSFKLLAPLARPITAHVRRDLAYGPDVRQRLDLFTPSGKVRSGRRPILLFVHGGGFVGGDKNMGVFFDTIANWCVEHGLIGATMTYRLAPAARWPSGAEDLAGAVHWLKQHGAAHGGNGRRIYLMGHSAGATHCASLFRHFPDLAETLAGVILASGIYDLAAPGFRPIVAAYADEDDAGGTGLDLIADLASSTVRMGIVLAELEPAAFHRDALRLLRALLDRDGILPPFARLAGHNHYSSILSVGSDLGREFEAFLREFIGPDDLDAGGDEVG